MFSSFVIPGEDGKEALAAPTIPAEIRSQSIVILIVAIMSIIGTSWIMLSHAVFPVLRSFRHRLILGLAISDFITAFNFLCSTSLNIGGRFIGAPSNARFCSYNGFMTQVFVIQTDYWVLTIAICTYLVMVGQRRSSNWVQNHEAILWAIPWFFSILWASVGLIAVGYGDIGAWCWFTSDTIRLLVNFIPRWAIIVIIFVLYACLYLVLYKAQTRLSSVEDALPYNRNSAPTSTNASQGSSFHEGAGSRSSASIRRLKRIARLMLLYPLAYAIIWSLPTAIRIYQAAENKPAPFALQTIDKSSIVIQGFVDAVIYGVNETSISCWRARLSRRRYPTIEEMNAQGLDGRQSADVGGERAAQLSSRRTPSSSISGSTTPGELIRDELVDGIQLKKVDSQGVPAGRGRTSREEHMGSWETGCSEAVLLQQPTL